MRDLAPDAAPKPREPVDNLSVCPPGSATLVSMEQAIWFDIDLKTVPEYDVWKPESLEWAMSIDWQRVNTVLRDHLADLPAHLSGVARAQRALEYADAP